VRSKGTDGVLSLLLRTGLSPAPLAAAAWRAVEPTLDIEHLDEHEHDALCLAGSRLGELGVGSDETERISGLVRHAWVSTQLALETVASAPTDQAPVLVGRLATVVAYLPEGRRLPVAAAASGTWDGPTTTVDVNGRCLRVPTLAGQLVDSSIRRQWTEVACLLIFDINSEEVAAEALRRGRSAAVRYAVKKVARIMGSETIPPGSPPTIPRDLRDEGLERLRRPLDAARAARSRRHHLSANPA
jgi:hypothetical protein